MDYLDTWGEFLAPQGGFQWQDAWQLLVLALILVLATRFFPNRGSSDDIERYSPILWISWNRAFLVFWLSLALLYGVFAGLAGMSVEILRFVTFLGGAWILIGLLSSFLREKFWAESVALVAYLVTGLFGLALVEDSIRILEEVRFTVGTFTITAWAVLAGVIAFAFTLWISLAIARIIEGRVQRIPKLTPSLRVLISKIVRIVLVLEAAASVERVLSNPRPVCLLTGFGDSSVDLELRFWIADPSNGVSNVKSQVLLKVWDTFKENGIEIPFPQRDLHLRSAETLPVSRQNPDPA